MVEVLGHRGKIMMHHDDGPSLVAPFAEDLDDRLLGHRIDALEGRLIAQMAAADAAIAELEQKVNYITSLFESMRTASKSYSS